MGDSVPTTSKMAEAVVAGRRLLCLSDSSLKPGDCADVHNKAAWATRQGLQPAALEGWKLAYDFAVSTVSLKCRKHVGDIFHRDDLNMQAAGSQYLECTEKALSGARGPLGRKPITLLDGRAFDFKSFLITLGGGDKTPRDISRKGEDLLCMGNAVCKNAVRKAVQESRQNLKPHQNRWWNLVYDYAVQTTRLKCLLKALDTTLSTNLSKRPVRAEYLACANATLKGEQRISFVRLLDGMLFSWANFLKVPLSLTPMPPRLAVVAVRNTGRNGRRVRGVQPRPAPDDGSGGGSIRISPGSGNGGTRPAGGRKVLRCDNNGCD